LLNPVIAGAAMAMSSVSVVSNSLLLGAGVPKTRLKGNAMEEVTIKVGGMSCQGCVKNVTGALSATPGVASVAVSLEAGEARVSYDPARCRPTPCARWWKTAASTRPERISAIGFIRCEHASLIIARCHSSNNGR
jgi:copper chaperone